MKKIVLITGANGMLAKTLAQKLDDEFLVRFLTREPVGENEYLWDIKSSYIDPKAIADVHSVIHLAGAPIAEKRWTKNRKQSIVSSRVDGARLILSELKKHKITIDSFISASAIGYYGTKTTNRVFDEESPNGNDFLSDVCEKWESAALSFKLNRIAERVAIIRIGIIFSKNDGALKKIVRPIKLGFGSGIGDGNQFTPWIHIQDLCEVFNFVLLNNNIQGIFNAVSPEHITNIELTKSIGAILKKPLILPNIPAFIIRLIFGEMSQILLNGSKVSSNKILSKGFNFHFGNLDKALKDVLND